MINHYASDEIQWSARTAKWAGWLALGSNHLSIATIALAFRATRSLEPVSCGATLEPMTTSKKVASDASKELKTQTSRKEKEVAASALAQAARKGKPAKRK